MIIAGLQTKGVFCLHCEVTPESIAVGRLWLRDWELLGQTVSLVESDGCERFTVQLPANPIPFPCDDVRLLRVAALQ